AGPEAGGPLQHPVAEAAEAGLVPTGLDRPVRAAATAKDQAAGRAAIAPCRGETRARAAREGRRHGQDRARAQRVIARVRRGVTAAYRASRSSERWSIADFKRMKNNGSI